MRNSKPQRCVQQHKLLKVTRNATNGDKHINEATKQIFANNLFRISCKYTQGMFSNPKICFIALKIRNYEQPSFNLSKIDPTLQKMTCTTVTSQFDVS